MSHVSQPNDPVRSVRRAAVVILAITVIAILGWTWRSAAVMQREANAAVDPLSQVSTDPDELEDTLLLLKTSSVHARAARAASDALPLRVAGRLPFFGDDIRAARTLATALDNSVTKAGVPLVELAQQLLDVPPNSGDGANPVVNTAALADAEPVIAQATAAVSTSHRELATINAASIINSLSVPVTLATDLLGDVDTVLAQANNYAPFAGDLLGAQQPREYLLIFENLAEARPTGGIVGKWALVRVDKGVVELVDVGANENLNVLSLQARPELEPDFVKLYGPSIGPVANANLTPNFPDAARLILATWAEQGREAPDGVVSVDTRAIARLLELTGPISVPSPGADATIVVGTDNFVQVAQADIYQWYAGREEERQAFLTALTAQMLDRLASQDLSMRNLFTTVAEMVQDGQFLAYSPDDAEQAALGTAGVSGELPKPISDQAFVFLTDNGGSKLQNYLRLGTCASTDQVAARIKNEVPGDFGQSLPDYVLNQRSDAPRGDQLVTLAIYLPAGRGLAKAEVDGQRVSVQAGTERDWALARVPLSVPPGQTRTVTFTLTGSGDAPRVQTQSLTHPVTELDGVCG